MEHEDSRPSRDLDWFRRVDDNGERALRAISHSIQPGTAVPPTVLVSAMGDGTIFIEGSRERPCTCHCFADAAPLRRELARAGGNSALTWSSGQGEAR